MTERRRRPLVRIEMEIHREVVTYLTDFGGGVIQDARMSSDGTYTLTVATAHRMPVFRREIAARLMVETLLLYRGQRKYLLHEFVVMPEHADVLITLAEGVTVERVAQLVKGGFAFRMGVTGVWEDGFRSYRVKDGREYEAERDRIRASPVRALLAGREHQYMYSSAAGLVRLDAAPEWQRELEAVLVG